MSLSPVTPTKTWWGGEGAWGGRRTRACLQAAGGALNRNAAVVKIAIVCQGEMKLL